MQLCDRIVCWTSSARRAAIASWMLWLLLIPALAAGDEPIDQLVRQLRQPLIGGRVEAAKQLARYGGRAAPAIPALVECLHDSENDMRLVAAYALGCIGHESGRVLDALVDVLGDADEHVRYSAQWSIARVANALDEKTDTITCTQCLPLLHSAAKELATHEHQARHRLAIEAAIARLAKKASDETRAAETPGAPPQPAGQPDMTENHQSSVAASVYAASDLLARYQFAEQLRDEQNFSDATRRLVVDIESHCMDTQVLRYAIRRWGAQGQSILCGLLDEMPSRGALGPADAAIIELVEPTEAKHCEQLVQLATDREQSIEVRAAALRSLSKAKTIHRSCLDRWVAIIASPAEDAELRAIAADALAELGAPAAKAETGLIALLKRTNEAWLRSAITAALGKIAPGSSTAADAVQDALRGTPIDDDSYADLIDATGNFGSLAIGSLQQLIAGLEHSELAVRLACAQILSRFGSAATGASDALVARIIDPEEVVSVKNGAAMALAKIGPEGLTRLVTRMTEADEAPAIESSLRALAISGPQANFAASNCLVLLDDARQTVAVRSAAATALGAMGKRAIEASPALARWCGPGQPDALRAASLIALAQVDPPSAQARMKELGSARSILMRASTAFATHLCGDSRAGFDDLIDLLDGSDTDSIIEQTLADFGAVIQPWLVEVAADANAGPHQRLACFRLAYRPDNGSRAELVQLVADFDLGEQFADCMEADWYEDVETMAGLVTLLRNEQLPPVARVRIACRLTPDGLGAADDDEDWTGPTLTKPLAVEMLDSARQSGQASVPRIPNAGLPPAGGAAPPAWMPPPWMPPAATSPAAPSPAAEPRGGGVSRNDGSAGGPPDAAGGAPINPAIPPRASSAETVAAVGEPQTVKVFYGTNRVRLDTDNMHHELAVSVLATAGGSLLAMVLCLVGFLRGGNRGFAAIALLAIGIVAPFGYLAVNKYSRASLHVPVVYGVDYQPKVELGMCEVSIPPGHQPGMLEAPNIFTLKVKEDINKHVVLTDVAQFSNDQFYDHLHRMLDNRGKNVLVFIHGYNVSFEDAARRTAQMAVDLKFPGAPVFYSWPSQANWYGYATDKENIQRSVAQIKSFLLELAERSGADTINLVAHSMGNVGLTQALKEMEAAGQQPLFNQVVLAAPDIDAEVFKTAIAPHIVTKAHHVTLYTSQTDLALIASHYFNQASRVGDSRSGVVLFPGIDTIDATDVDSSLLGHSYYGSNVTVLTDLARVLENQPIANREYLRAIADAPQPYWAFDPLRITQRSSPVTNH